jgi:hypothetical protein
MHSFLRPTLFFLVATISFTAATLRGQEKKKEAKKTAPGKTAAAEPTPKPAGTNVGDLPIPSGAPQKEVRFPIFSPDGKKKLYYRIGVATRMPDGENIVMSEMELQTYDENGKEESIVKLPDAILHTPTNVITAKAKILIRDERYEITANSLSYNMDAKTEDGKSADRVATLGGGVKMTIFDTDAVMGPGKKNDGPEIKIEPLKDEPAKK